VVDGKYQEHSDMCMNIFNNMPIKLQRRALKLENMKGDKAREQKGRGVLENQRTTT
jgi:hypothetical protein